MSDDLAPSRLGTKAHWDSVYRDEVDNWEEFGDEGEVWFGEDSVEKMVDWALDNVPISSLPYCLDIGTGNGSLLFALAESGYDPTRLQGIDYSEDSIQLARKIAISREHEKIAFSVSDFINDQPPSISGIESSARWDLLLDKGTYDAIALSDIKLPDGRELIEAYPAQVDGALVKGGYFLITSCNFTEDELKAKFDCVDTGLRYHSRVAHPTFSFGGKTGSTVSTLAFCKQ